MDGLARGGHGAGRALLPARCDTNRNGRYNRLRVDTVLGGSNCCHHGGKIKSKFNFELLSGNSAL